MSLKNRDKVGRRRPVSFRISGEVMRRFRDDLADAVHPIIEAQDRIRELSIAMAPCIGCPGGYVGPENLTRELVGEYAELDRLNRNYR